MLFTQDPLRGSGAPQGTPSAFGLWYIDTAANGGLYVSLYNVSGVLVWRLIQTGA